MPCTARPPVRESTCSAGLVILGPREAREKAQRWDVSRFDILPLPLGCDEQNVQPGNPRVARDGQACNGHEEGRRDDRRRLSPFEQESRFWSP
jgi:hypothetical protein